MWVRVLIYHLAIGPLSVPSWIFQSGWWVYSHTDRDAPVYPPLEKLFIRILKFLNPGYEGMWGGENMRKKSFKFWAVRQSQVYQCTIMHEANLTTLTVIGTMCSTIL